MMSWSIHGGLAPAFAVVHSHFPRLRHTNRGQATFPPPLPPRWCGPFLQRGNGVRYRGRKNYNAIMGALANRYASLTRLEDPTAFLDRLLVEEFRSEEGGDRSAITTLAVSRIERTAPIALRSHRDSGAKLRSLTRVPVGIPWAPQASFRPPAIQKYYAFVDGFFHAMRTLDIHAKEDT